MSILEDCQDAPPVVVHPDVLGDHAVPAHSGPSDGLPDVQRSGGVHQRVGGVPGNPDRFTTWRFIRILCDPSVPEALAVDRRGNAEIAVAGSDGS